ncbi:RNA ligase [Microbacterium phage phiMiGM15]
MSAIPFEPWPKTPRLNRDVIFTEKIDGTNAAVVILPLEAVDRIETEGRPVEFFSGDAERIIAVVDGFVVLAQSRNRFITPSADNAGFARFVAENAAALVATLGPGHHFGEWWGSGIQRGYGLTGGEKRFSLFNAARWGLEDLSAVPGLGAVPILPFSRIEDAADAVDFLRQNGSLAAPGFDRPEGVIAWHTAARTSFKALLEGDDFPKGNAA